MVNDLDHTAPPSDPGVQDVEQPLLVSSSAPVGVARPAASSNDLLLQGAGRAQQPRPVSPPPAPPATPLRRPSPPSLGPILERTSLPAGSGHSWPGADGAEAGEREPPRTGRNPRLSAPSSVLAARADTSEPDRGGRRASGEPPGAQAPRLGSGGGGAGRLAPKDAGSSNSLVLDILAEAADMRATSLGSNAGGSGAQQAAQPEGLGLGLGLGRFREEPARGARASEGWPAYLLPRVLTGAPSWLGVPERDMPERGDLAHASSRGEAPPPWAARRASASAQIGRLRLPSAAAGLAQVCGAQGVQLISRIASASVQGHGCRFECFNVCNGSRI